MAKLSDYTVGLVIVVAQGVWMKMEKSSRPRTVADPVFAIPPLPSPPPRDHRYLM
jgi:hypothetical protein